jgi:hypothetical protein
MENDHSHFMSTVENATRSAVPMRFQITLELAFENRAELFLSHLASFLAFSGVEVGKSIE